MMDWISVQVWILDLISPKMKLTHPRINYD